jgi:hypothetical protein
MNAELQYLKAIADALKKIKAAGGLGSSGKSDVTLSGNLDTTEITNVLAKGLVVKVVEGEGSSAQEVDESVLKLLYDTIEETLQDAMFTTVNQTEKSYFELMANDIAGI